MKPKQIARSLMAMSLAGLARGQFINTKTGEELDAAELLACAARLIRAQRRKLKRAHEAERETEDLRLAFEAQKLAREELAETHALNVANLERAKADAEGWRQAYEKCAGNLLDCAKDHGDSVGAAWAADEELARHRKALDEIEELNMSAEDDDGNRWANSDLIAQAILEARGAFKSVEAQIREGLDLLPAMVGIPRGILFGGTEGGTPEDQAAAMLKLDQARADALEATARDLLEEAGKIRDRTANPDLPTITMGQYARSMVYLASEVAGCFEEYSAMPCKSLRNRLAASIEALEVHRRRRFDDTDLEAPETIEEGWPSMAYHGHDLRRAFGSGYCCGLDNDSDAPTDAQIEEAWLEFWGRFSTGPAPEVKAEPVADDPRRDIPKGGWQTLEMDPLRVGNWHLPPDHPHAIICKASTEEAAEAIADALDYQGDREEIERLKEEVAKWKAQAEEEGRRHSAAVWRRGYWQDRAEKEAAEVDNFRAMVIRARDLVGGDSTGDRWKRDCNVFCDDAADALAGGKGGAE